MKKFITVLVIATIFIGIIFWIWKHNDAKIEKIEEAHAMQVIAIWAEKSDIEIIEERIQHAIDEANQHKYNMNHSHQAAEQALEDMW